MAKLRRGARGLVAALVAARVAALVAALVAAPAPRELWEKVRAGTRHITEQPRSLATLANGTIGLAVLLTVVIWAASGSGPAPQPAPPAGDDSGLLLAAQPVEVVGPAAGSENDRGGEEDRGGEDTYLTDQPLGLDAPASLPATPQSEPDEPAITTSPLPTYSFVVSSRPLGARVRVDGELLGQASPVTIQVEPGARYTLRLELDGHQPLTWGFSLEELTPAHMDSRELYFPLQPLAVDISAEELAPTANAETPLFGISGAAGAQAGRATSPVNPSGGPPPSPGTIRRVRVPAQAPAPEKLRHVDPTLPAGAALDGIVVLEIEVSARGNVVQAKVLRGLDPVSNQAALDAVVRWKYEATAVAGVPVHVLMTVTVPIRRSATR